MCFDITQIFLCVVPTFLKQAAGFNFKMSSSFQKNTDTDTFPFVPVSNDSATEVNLSQNVYFGKLQVILKYILCSYIPHFDAITTKKIFSWP